jgi:hypothetical protein
MHFFRINARVGSQWYIVTSGRFETIDCNNVMRTKCSAEDNGRVDVTFLVRQPAITERAAPLESWLDLSLHPGGFPSGTFIAAGPFSVRSPFNHPFGTLFEWRGLLIVSRHYWRTNTLFQFFGSSNTWVRQNGGSFLTHDCNTLLRAA